MERINRILENEEYRSYVRRIEEAERERRFCLHNMGHFLDVCRLALLEYYEAGQKGEVPDLRIDWIYGAGLLHDIGRFMEYESGIPHEKASAGLAPGILRDCGFSEKEINCITEAIENHRNKEVSDRMSLSGFLYRGDKKSRPCFACKAERECDWSSQKKNLKLLR
ncbi:MAG: HD domain-containing protein [Lachnospiraceae bacterium]|nr:HD domain-containing protein [Lachnospiraceae bacterium]